MSEPRTEAERLLGEIRHALDIAPGEDGYWRDRILAIEAEARADALREATERVKVLDIRSERAGDAIYEVLVILRDISRADG